MTVFTLILVFLMNGQVQITQRDFDTQEACELVGNALVKQQLADPKFDEGLFAACVPNKKVKV